MFVLLSGKLGLALAATAALLASSLVWVGAAIADGGPAATYGLATLATAMAGLAAALLKAVLKTNKVGFELANEREREIARLRWEVSFWQAKAMDWPEPPPFVAPAERHV